MESLLHRLIMNLLIEVLEHHLRDRRDFFVGGNMFFYFSALQARANDFRGPDFFVVLNTEKRNRDSWVLWEENGQVPNVIIEITSPSTASVDRGEKKRIYGKVLRVPEYFIYDPRSAELEGYRFNLAAQDYEPIEKNDKGRMRCEQLRLELGIAPARFMGYEDTFLRFYTQEGQLLPTHEEDLRAREQDLRAEQKRAEELAERLAAYERSFGPLPR